MRLPLEIENRLDFLRSEIERNGIELLEVQFRRNGSRGFLTFVVDKQGGVTLDDCADINRRVGETLDRESELEAGSFLKGSYLLEVCSPGLDRPLKNYKDFTRAQNERVRVAWKSAEGAGLVTIGNLLEVSEKELMIRDLKGQEVRIGMDMITKANRDVKP